jgi:hypothetical protein
MRDDHSRSWAAAGLSQSLAAAEDSVLPDGACMYCIIILCPCTAEKGTKAGVKVATQRHQTSRARVLPSFCSPSAFPAPTLTTQPPPLLPQPFSYPASLGPDLLHRMYQEAIVFDEYLTITSCDSCWVPLSEIESDGPRHALEEGIQRLFAADFPPPSSHRIVSVRR